MQSISQVAGGIATDGVKVTASGLIWSVRDVGENHFSDVVTANGLQKIPDAS